MSELSRRKFLTVGTAGIVLAALGAENLSAGAKARSTSTRYKGFQRSGPKFRDILTCESDFAPHRDGDEIVCPTGDVDWDRTYGALIRQEINASQNVVDETELMVGYEADPLDGSSFPLNMSDSPSGNNTFRYLCRMIRNDEGCDSGTIVLLKNRVVRTASLHHKVPVAPVALASPPHPEEAPHRRCAPHFPSIRIPKWDTERPAYKLREGVLARVELDVTTGMQIPGTRVDVARDNKGRFFNGNFYHCDKTVLPGRRYAYRIIALYDLKINGVPSDPNDKRFNKRVNISMNELIYPG